MISKCLVAGLHMVWIEPFCRTPES
jgi:hypothetical protein